VAVASAGPYATMPAPHHSSLSSHPTNSIKALKANMLSKILIRTFIRQSINHISLMISMINQNKFTTENVRPNNVQFVEYVKILLQPTAN